MQKNRIILGKKVCKKGSNELGKRVWKNSNKELGDKT